MPDIWDLDEDAIARDEISATISLALVALRRGEKPPMDTPLQRTIARVVGPIWTNREVRLKLHQMRVRAGL